MTKVKHGFSYHHLESAVKCVYVKNAYTFRYMLMIEVLLTDRVKSWAIHAVVYSGFSPGGELYMNQMFAS